jgi:drug/metabolite transporter (DMT)-like permease
MLGAGVAMGERPAPLQWAGAVLAMAGLVYLVLPGVTAPPLGPALLMALAGAAWAGYSIRGRVLANPLAQTTGNFVRAIPLAALPVAAMLPQTVAEPQGVVLALTSGAVASGLGYVAWYAALRGLTAMHAGVVQLAGPVLAGAGGVLLLGEPLSVRLVVAAAMVLGGIAMAIRGRRRV